MGKSKYEILDKDDRRTLTLAGSTCSLGKMVLSDPDKLVFTFAHVMMHFQWFLPEPSDILLIGLGGGGLQKHLYRHMPHTHLTTLEIDPEIIEIAHAKFHVPQDNERFKVILMGAEDYVPHHPASCDVILSDAYEDTLIPAALTTQNFYRDCHGALRRNGILVINFFEYDAEQITLQMEMLQSVFHGGVYIAPGGLMPQESWEKLQYLAEEEKDAGFFNKANHLVLLSLKAWRNIQRNQKNLDQSGFFDPLNNTILFCFRTHPTFISELQSQV